MLPWFQVEAHEVNDALADLTLRVGYTDGTTTGTFPIPFDREQRIPPTGIGFMSGSATGSVVIGLDDGSRSQVRVIDVATGQERLIHESERPIVGGAMHPDGSVLYVLAVDRDTGGSPELWRLDPRGPAPVAEPADPAWLDGLPLGDLRGDAPLLFTPEGSRLIAQSCFETRCRARSVRLSDGVVTSIHGPGTGPLVGLTDDALLAHPSQWGATKDFVFAWLDDGTPADIDVTGAAATLAADLEGPLVVLEEAHGEAAYVVIDPMTGAHETLTLPERIHLQGTIASIPHSQGLHPPPGHVVFADEGRIAIDGPTDPHPTLFELATGEWRQLVNLR